MIMVIKCVGQEAHMGEKEIHAGLCYDNPKRPLGRTWYRQKHLQRNLDPPFLKGPTTDNK
jgi:hypothetical protein